MRRRLIQTEVDFLQRYFGTALDTSSIRLAAARGRRAYAIHGNHIWLPRQDFMSRDTTASVNLLELSAATLAHEATHVWQRQRGLWVTLKGAVLQLGNQCGIDPYAYDRWESDPTTLLSHFLTGNIEQQGQIVQDLVFCDLTGQTVAKFCEVHAYLLSSL